MSEVILPRWNVRLDAVRSSNDYTDLLSIVNHHLDVHRDMDQFLGPYNAKQRSKKFYEAPDKELLKELIHKHGMNDFSYLAYLNNIIKFCENYKGNRAIPAPHPSTIHSIQLPIPAFELKQNFEETEIFISGAEEPLLVKGLHDINTVRFIIVRQKLSKLGTASVKNWEVLFFRNNISYIPEWVDSELNPRYAGRW